MARRGGMSMGGQGMMQQVKKLQQEMMRIQEELAEETVTASAGGGVVKAEVTGDQRCVSIEIDPALVEDGDVEMLQDLVLAAVNNGLEKSQELAAERLGPLAGGNLPF
ncbi:MAG: Nucleoid-associated protein [Chloroflexi bacterium]|nr:Nucleoid-associated protein [Chloroflexota bacterium]